MWLGLKPAVQFFAGATLLRQNPALAAEFYTLVLLWTAGYELCAIVADRQLVVLANQVNRKPLVAFRSLVPLLLGIALVLTTVCALIGSTLSAASFVTALAICGLGAVAGIAEAGFWAGAADVGAFRTLAIARALSTGAFVALLVAAVNGIGSVAVALAAETASITLAFAALFGREIASVRPVPLSAERVFGFYLVKVVSYLNRFVESWWAVAALSGIALAAFRVGLAPKSFLMMAFSALVQPTLFRVSASDWAHRRAEAQREVTLAADVLIVLASGAVALTSATALLLPSFVEPYKDALGVAWASLAFFCGPGWFGLLASSLVTNWGAIRLPILATVVGLALRSSVYGLLLWVDHFALLTMTIVAEAVTAVTQNAFWRRVLAEKLWAIDTRTAHRALGRSCLSLGSLLLWLTADGAIPLIVLCAAHALVAGEAVVESVTCAQASRRTPRIESTRSKSPSE